MTYGALVLLLILALGVAFYRYHARFLERRARETYTLIGDRIARQLDDVLSSMDFVLINLMSDAEFKTALVTLDTTPRGDAGPSVTMESAAQTIARSLSMHSFYREQLEVVANTRAGDLFSSDYLAHRMVRGHGEWGVLPPWHETVFAADGPPVVVGPFIDPWTTLDDDLQFGVARSIRGANGSLAILGAYQSMSSLDALLTTSIEGVNNQLATVIAVKPSGEILHASRPLSEREREAYLAQATTSAGFVYREETGHREFVAVAPMESGWGRVVIAVNSDILVDALGVTQALIAALGGVIFLVSVAYTYFSSRALTRPLREIEANIEATDLQNLGVGPPIEHYNDELVALDRAVNRMKTRLDVAVGREIAAHTAAVRARLDSLQAQVNPHFLYNTLTVVANRGLELGDTVIGEMCDGLASMLRYSTATTTRFARIRDEVDHVQAYLYLMENRLESRLRATVEIDESIMDAQIPKIVLQQLAENAIAHGYRDSPDPIEIEIRGAREGALWRISVADRGKGFSPQRLEELQASLRAVDNEISEERAGRGLEIGGLGILNTYSRMALFFDGRLEWTMANRTGGGAIVEIAAPVVVEETADV